MMYIRRSRSTAVQVISIGQSFYCKWSHLIHSTLVYIWTYNLFDTVLWITIMHYTVYNGGDLSKNLVHTRCVLWQTDVDQ